MTAKIIRGWPLGLLLAAAGGFLAWLYWMTAITYTIGAQPVTAARMNAVCTSPYLAGSTPGQVFGGNANQVCASAAQVEGNKAAALIIAIVLAITAVFIMIRRRQHAASVQI